MSEKLKVKIKDIEFASPVIAASGTFGFGVEYSDIVNLDDFGAIVTKGISLLPREGNPPPRIVETPCGLINSIGLANPGTDAFIETYKDIYENFPTKVIVNIGAETGEEFLTIIEKIEKMNVIGYEINISCPNVEKGGMMFSEDPNQTYSLIRHIRNSTNKLIITKLSPNFCNIKELAKASEEAGSDAISLVNTFLGMSVDIETGDSRIGKLFGGFSGPAIKPMALKMVYDTVRTVKIPVIGIGGINSGSDAVEYLLVGAQMVQVGSAIFKNPQIAFDINNFLEKYIERKGFSNIKGIIGTFKGSRYE
ncbi:MAG: dihydroorotate dehydrogenase [Proteobacteria bacterium]|nr:dihydroorotate dehydrogenase [Pseudomonadota bacterium]